MTAQAIITRRKGRWTGPQPAPEDYDGYLYTCTAGAIRFSSYGLAWVEGRARNRVPGAELVREWEQ